MHTYRRLKVWDKAHDYVLEVYKATERFPRREQFRLTNQLIRAATSIAMNIAEGCGRTSYAAFAGYLDIASGSASESEYQLLLACELGYLSRETHESLTARINEISRMLRALHRTVRKTAARQQAHRGTSGRAVTSNQ